MTWFVVMVVPVRFSSCGICCLLIRGVFPCCHPLDHSSSSSMCSVTPSTACHTSWQSHEVSCGSEVPESFLTFLLSAPSFSSLPCLSFPKAGLIQYHFRWTKLSKILLQISDDLLSDLY